MRGVADRDVAAREPSKITIRPSLHDDVQEMPRLLRGVFGPNAAINFETEKVRTPKLRIVRILSRPISERVGGLIDPAANLRVRRIRSGADERVFEDIVDFEQAHLQRTKVFVRRRLDVRSSRRPRLRQRAAMRWRGCG